MNYCKLFFIVICWVSFNSCSERVTKVYFHDTGKVDDGEIFGKEVEVFFIPDTNIHLYNIKSNEFDDELRTIKDSINSMRIDQEPDDSYYTYAFITTSKDTIFADHRLTYWKYKEKNGI